MAMRTSQGMSAQQEEAAYPIGTTHLRMPSTIEFAFHPSSSFCRLCSADLNGIAYFCTKDSHNEWSEIHTWHGEFKTSELRGTCITDHVDGYHEDEVGALAHGGSLALSTLSSSEAITNSSFEVCREDVDTCRVELDAQHGCCISMAGGKRSTCCCQRRSRAPRYGLYSSVST